MQKRGLSTIIATIMMILFVLIAAGVVWMVIQNILSQETEEISSGLDRITLSIIGSSVNITDTEVSLVINRDIGKGSLVKIKIILYDDEGESYSQDVPAETLSELGSKKFSVNKGGLTNINKISIAPITKSTSGKETLKGIVNTYKVEESKTSQNNEENTPEETICADSETQLCTIANGIGEQTCSNGNWGTCTVTSCNSGYAPSENACVEKKYSSCLEILNDNTDDGDKVYTIYPDGVNSVDIYCDMTTDGGGWTLVITGGNFQFGKSHGFWSGTGNTNQQFTYQGETFNTRNSEKIIKDLAFTNIRIIASDKQGIFSSSSSTFAQKKSAQTPWTKVSGNLDSLSWNINDVDGYSRGEFLLGTKVNYDCGHPLGSPTCYGDYYWYYIGGDVHSVGNYYGHWFNWVGESDDCGNSQGCTNVNYIRYHGIGFNRHRGSYSISTDALFFR